MLFLDEFNLASKAVMGSCYQVILDHGIGSLKLADGVQIMAAGNRKADMCNVTQMPPALVNRLSVFTLDKPGTSVWVDWACSHGVRPDVIGFLLQHPDMLMTEPGKAGSNDASFATPRSWELTSKLLDALAFVKTDREGGVVTRKLTTDDALLAAASLVGDGHATMFAAFCMNAQTLDIDALLADPASVNTVGKKNGETDLSVRWAIVAGVADRVKTESSGKTKSKVVLRKALAVVRHLEEGELAVELCRFLKKACDVQMFVSEVLRMKHNIPDDTPADSPLVPQSARAEYEIYLKITHYANLLDVMKSC
jgi:hypothetical protein